MITIVLIIAAGVIFLLAWLGIVNKPLILFLIVAIIVGGLAFTLKDRLSCPFAKKCPFTICPLNKSK